MAKLLLAASHQHPKIYVCLAGRIAVFARKLGAERTRRPRLALFGNAHVARPSRAFGEARHESGGPLQSKRPALSALCAQGHRRASPEGDNRCVIRVRANNRLLDGLPAKCRSHMLSVCEPVDLTIGDVLQAPDERIRHVYFPVSGIISLLVPVEGHGNLEVALVGREGFLGTPTVLGIRTSPLQGLVQDSGAALRLSAPAFRRELESSPAMRRTLSKYAYVLIAQLAESAGCIRFHLLEARLARWLLMTHDRAGSNEFHLTHEFLAQMLGVRRVGVTNAAGDLQKRNLIAYTRGAITVLDRPGLEAASCPCYRTGQDIYEHILG